MENPAFWTQPHRGHITYTLRHTGRNLALHIWSLIVNVSMWWRPVSGAGCLCPGTQAVSERKRQTVSVYLQLLVSLPARPPGGQPAPCLRGLLFRITIRWAVLLNQAQAWAWVNNPCRSQKASLHPQWQYCSFENKHPWAVSLSPRLRCSVSAALVPVFPPTFHRETRNRGRGIKNQSFYH